MRLILFLFFLLPLTLRGQQFHAVDEYSLHTPNGKTRTPENLAQHLSEGASTDVEKLRAIYAWVTLNIRYRDNYNSSDFWATPEYIEEQRAEQVLSNRTAICQGFANLFCALAKEMDIPAEVVTGIVKESDGNVPRLGHAWVAAQAEGRWHLFDPTWGVPPPGSQAYQVQDYYFMAEPARFVLNHLPDDPAWQLLEKPVGERFFRESSAAEITLYLQAEAVERFAYQDTLAQWLQMDSVQRMLDMESRVVQFNGSNERALFSLGQNYWGLFYDLHFLLDSLTDEAIMQDTVHLDSWWFLDQTAKLENYHQRARALFGRIESPERLARVEKFYTPDDVAALINKLKGSFWTGQFEKAYHRDSQTPQETQLPQLRALMALADSAYTAAESSLDCEKLYHTCVEIWHNRSLAHIQFAQREVQLLERMLNEKPGKDASSIVTFFSAEIRSFFGKAAVDVQQMMQRPPVFALTRQRQISIQQGLYSLRACEIRARRAAIMPAVEEAVGNPSFTLQKSESLVRQLVSIQSDLYQFIDSVENSTGGLERDFSKNILFNLQYETFALQYSLGSLRYRNAWYLGQQARQMNTLAKEKDKIRAAANQVFAAAKEANSALNEVLRFGQVTGSHVEQRRQQVNKLKEAAQQLLNTL